jgi:hypothetical protein
MSYLIFPLLGDYFLSLKGLFAQEETAKSAARMTAAMMRRIVVFSEIAPTSEAT